MIAGLSPYPDMEDSGVPWLREVPAHWAVVRGRHLFEIKKRIVGELGHPVLSVTQEGLRRKNIETGEGQQSQDYSKYQIVETGEFAMNSMDLLTGGVGIAARPGVTSPDYRVFAVRDETRSHRTYMLRVLRMLYRNRGFYSWGQGSAQLGRWRLPRKRFNDFPFPSPSFAEQSAIVRFLDYADRRIRRYIRAKQKLIKLLDEQKHAIIHRAITRGLDPNVRLKPSGVEWLENIPQHWEVLRSKYLFREIDRRSADGSEEHLSMSQRLGLVPSHLVENRTLVSESYAGGKLCEVGDLVLNRLKAHLGVFALAEYAGVVSPDYTVLRPLDLAGTAYFESVLRSPACRRELRVRAKGIVEGFWRLYTDDFYDIRLPVPPGRERVAIVEHNRRTTREMNLGISRTEREISLLSEYRTRLIADVVTGKLDVREAAQRLPDEPEQPGLLDETHAVADGEEEPAADLGPLLEEAGT